MNAADYPFESFNARSLSPAQVAIGFVPPPAFSLLCKRRHSIVAGPRGSGKTTLLKMLQVSALRSWNHPEADKLRSQIDFTGVFVPTDRAWSEQLSSIGSNSLSSKQADQLSVSAFTTQTLRALVSAVIERTLTDPKMHAADFRLLNLSADAEVRLSSQTAGLWGLTLEAPTLLGLRSALSRRMLQIHEIASSCTFRPVPERDSYFASHAFLHIEFLAAISGFLDIFEQFTRADGEKWALLFDELELAPPTIRERLFKALRSVDARILFKLSLAPFSKELEENPQAASETNDYELIKLWYASKEDGYGFSGSLIEHVFRQRDIGLSPEAVFGATTGVLPRSRKKGEYSRAEIFRELAKRDLGFKRYLVRENIALDKISLPGEAQQAASLRKVVAIVELRNAYLKRGDNDSKDATLRSRKAAHLYCGLPSLLAVCEGNPRWLIGLVDSLLDKADSRGKVSLAVQDLEVQRLISRFSAYLRTIPVAPGAPKEFTNVFSLVEQIGSALSREVLAKDFNSDPVGTFVVDSNTPNELISALELAVYAGAILFVPESHSQVAARSLRGKRFRVAYLLAPKYKLPLVLLRSKSLRALLSNSEIQEGLFK